MEKLSDRESSKCGTVRYEATRKGFVSAAKMLAQNAEHKAVYTSHTESALGRLRIHDEEVHKTLEDFVEIISPNAESGFVVPLSIDRLHTHIEHHRQIYPIAVMQDVFNIVEKEIVDMMIGFKDWKIYLIRYRFDMGGEGVFRSTVPHWHADRETHGQRGIVLAKTSIGPSTVFSGHINDNPDKNEAKKLHPPDAVMTAHVPGATMHRSPYQSETPGLRCTLIIKIAPK